MKRLTNFFLLVSFFLPMCLQASVAVKSKEYKLADDKIEMTLGVTEHSVQVNGIFDKQTGAQYLTEPCPLFDVEYFNKEVSSSTDQVVVTRVIEKNNALIIKGYLTSHPDIGFDVSLRISQPGVVTSDLAFENEGPRIRLNITYPNLTNYRKQGMKRHMYGMIPEEIGGVIPLEGKFSIGMNQRPNLFLPAAFNSMEVCSVYDYDTQAGMFCADPADQLKQGVLPIQFNLTDQALRGLTQRYINKGDRQELPTLSWGVYPEGGWQRAVDYYVLQAEKYWNIPTIPTWLREAGAIYSFSGGGAGGIYMKNPGRQLYQAIDSFEEMPKLLMQGQTLGSSIVYMWNYWEGLTPEDKRCYGNKGDYIPMTRLGGEKAFVNGVKKVHELGGKVFVYIEPFIICKDSKVAKKYGEKIAVRHPNGNLMPFYDNTYTMNPYSKIWRNHLKELFHRYIVDYDVDGVFLDSYSWRMNNTYTTNEENRLRTAQEYSTGELELIEELRNYAHSLKPQSIVLGETTAGPVWQIWDGGLSADFAWQIEDNKGRIVASPVRYGNPHVNFFSNGKNLNQFNQIYASGHNIALAYYQMEHVNYIADLLDIRRNYKDAMIYGKQIYQPWCDNEEATAYRYQGTDNEMLIMLNVSETTPMNGEFVLLPADKDKQWKCIFGDAPCAFKDGKAKVSLKPGEMIIFTCKQ